MKLKTVFQDENFKLGEVADVSMATIPDGRIVARATAKVGGEHTFYYDSLEAVYNDWKDYEEPKEYWYVSCDGRTLKATTDEDDYNEKHISGHVSIGNYFETKEEAEKAVEKLKAWKRLKDKGFKFADFSRFNDCVSIIRATFDESWSEIYDDLDLLFGGEA